MERRLLFRVSYPERMNHEGYFATQEVLQVETRRKENEAEMKMLLEEAEKIRQEVGTLEDRADELSYGSSSNSRHFQDVREMYSQIQPLECLLVAIGDKLAFIRMRLQRLDSSREGGGRFFGSSNRISHGLSLLD